MSSRKRRSSSFSITNSQFSLDNTMTISRVSNHHYSLLFMFIIIQISIQFSDPTAASAAAAATTATRTLHLQTKETSSDSLFSDPIVWDSSSLYITNSHGTTSKSRTKRSPNPSSQQVPATTVSNNQPSPFVDACQSKMEILTPYYATNSKGKLRTIVNTELMQQAIQVETCVRSTSSSTTSLSTGTGKCNAQPDCGCEQKYKWHRLLVLDPSDRETSNPKGLFMDWFLFPSNCVCRCKNPATTTSSKQFIRTLTGRKT